MWIILLLMSEIFLSLLYLYFAKVYLFVFVFFLYFVFYYSDKSEETGHRAWPALRSLQLWDHFTAVEYSFINEEEFANIGDRRLLFVLINNLTNMGLISGFGFHGTSVFGNLDLRYGMPPILFKVPGLREILLWSGAVSESCQLKQLKMGRSFISCPLKMGESGDFFEKIDPALFEYAKQHDLFLVPVTLEGEAERYCIWQSRFHQWSFARFGYPFPFFFYPQIFGSRPPKLMTVSIGSPLNPALQKDAAEFKRIFIGQARHLLGDF